MTNPYNKVVLARISDLSGGNPELKTLVLSAVSGTSVINGFFVDARGDQLGQAITINITTATTIESVLTLQQKSDSGWDSGKAVGLIGRLSGSAMYVGTGGDASDGSIRPGMSTDITYPEVATSEYFTLGRVSSVVNTGTPPTVTIGGGGGGTEYTEGSTDGSITGVAILMESALDTLRPVQGSITDGLLVNLGSNNDVTVTGAVTANLAAGANNIGDVDILTVPAPLNVTGGGTEAAALRVTIANNSTGVLSVDDNGSSLTVDGTVAATQSGTWTLGANSGVDIGDITINNTSGAGAVNIQDGGNSITVDAPTGTPVNVQIGDGTRQATVRDTGSNDSLNVSIVNSGGSQITSFSTQYIFGSEQAGSVGASTAIPLFDGQSGRPSRPAGALKIRLCNCSDTYNLLVRYDSDPTTTSFLECLLPLETRDIDCDSSNEARILAHSGTIDYVAQVLS
jgi:hypothetical protein